MEKKQEELEFLVFERITNQRVKGHSGSTPEDTSPHLAHPRPGSASALPGGQGPALPAGGRGCRDLGPV